MASYREHRLTMREVVQLRDEQEKFWVAYQNYIHEHEDMLGKFCRRHGRSVKAYPRIPSYGPKRLVRRYRIVYDIKVKDCYMCCLEDDCRQYTNPTKEDDWLPLFQPSSSRKRNCIKPEP
uniref:U2* protein n=1 Tax=Pea yellow stunt virus TaxID=1436892 RepID=V9TNI4_9VIRU|nr:U2* protein [Pea yellow stunt virus]